MDKFSPTDFLKACGATDRLGLRVEGEGRERPLTYWFRQWPFALVGRKPDNDIVLNDRRISRRHAYLQVLGGEVFCVDLNSRTGTHWQDGRRDAGWLAPDQTLRLGGWAAMSVLADPSSEPARADPFDPMARGCLPTPPLTLEFLGERWNNTRWPMNRLLAILGGAAWCNIRLHHAEVAPVHASLVAAADGVWMVDLLSPAGTWLNGEKVPLARLEDGDVLRIGDFEMRVHGEASAKVLLPVTTGPSAASEAGLAEAAVPNMTPEPSAEEQPAAPEARPVEPAAAAALAAPPEPMLRGPVARTNLVLTAGSVVPEGPAAQPQAMQLVVEQTAKAMLESVFFPMVQQFSNVQNQMFDQFQQAMTLMFQMFGSLQKDQMQMVRAELNRVQELTAEIQTLHTEMKAKAVVSPVLKSRAFAEPAATNGISHRAVPDSPAAHGASNGTAATNAQSPEEVHAWLCQRMNELESDRRSRLQKIADFLSGK